MDQIESRHRIVLVVYYYLGFISNPLVESILHSYILTYFSVVVFEAWMNPNMKTEDLVSTALR